LRRDRRRSRRILRNESEFPSKTVCRIDAGPDARIHAMFKEERLQYRMEEVAHYEKNTQDRGEGKRLGSEFLTAYMSFAANMDDADDKVALREKAEKALAAGASDPMVRMYYARILSHFDEMDEAMRIIREVVKPIEDGSYPAITKYMERSWLWILPRKDRPNGQMQVDSSVIEAAIDYLEAEADCDNQRIVYKPISGLFTGGDDRAKAALYEAVLGERGHGLVDTPHDCGQVLCGVGLRLAWPRLGTGGIARRLGGILSELAQ
jgi:hypothetical protein